MTEQHGGRTTAEIRLGQYMEQRARFSVATYDSGNEKALHEIALALRDEVERLRARVAELEPYAPIEFELVAPAQVQCPVCHMHMNTGDHTHPEASADPRRAAAVERLRALLARQQASPAMTARAAGTFHTIDPDTPEDAPAALLAQQLRTSQPDVTATDVRSTTELRLTVRPQSMEAWLWWLGMLSVDTRTVTCRGSVTTGHGRRGDVAVVLVGDGVGGLQADAFSYVQPRQGQGAES
ncbi:hypothetical protein AMK26_10535 [Streptomyces sp. CB03234]|uniref:hypothetical protein n=1 Tax=Streptomyces sp. (strain CB03234) TaxID=1703937 RepID=UPI00093C3502|nr:hypothetical protein [Streptomyces sp. CB03234]OKK06445.1 hypothetical protein AMK26_10535 [Streptomyces sp. CB03234]